jgi:hypothetical protein
MNTKDLDKSDIKYLKIKYTMSKYIKEKGLKNWAELDIKHTEEFAEFYITKKSETMLSKNKTLKGYAVQNFIYILLRVVEAESGKFIPKIFTSRLKRTIKRIARPILEANLQVKNRAKVFKQKEIKRVIEKLFAKNEQICNITAIALAITFTTGARLSDVLNIYISDIKIVTNKLGKFLKIHLRNSKNNLLGTNPEQLTFKINKSNDIKLEIYLNIFLNRQETPSEKLINLGGEKTSQVKKITYQLRKISLELGLKNILSAHSGRNSVLLMLCHSKLDEESKKIYMRWRANSNMPSHYRGLLLECSALGAAEKLTGKL